MNLQSLAILNELGLDYWQVRSDATFSCIPSQSKQKVGILCLCPQKWQNNQKTQQLLMQFLKFMNYKNDYKIIYLQKSIDNVESQLVYKGDMILNFTQSTCQADSRMIKIESTKFELMLENSQIKKQVMLDVFRNSVYDTGT